MFIREGAIGYSRLAPAGACSVSAFLPFGTDFLPIMGSRKAVNGQNDSREAFFRGLLSCEIFSTLRCNRPVTCLSHSVNHPLPT